MKTAISRTAGSDTARYEEVTQNATVRWNPIHIAYFFCDGVTPNLDSVQKDRVDIEFVSSRRLLARMYGGVADKPSERGESTGSFVSNALNMLAKLRWATQDATH